MFWKNNEKRKELVGPDSISSSPAKHEPKHAGQPPARSTAPESSILNPSSPAPKPDPALDDCAMEDKLTERFGKLRSALGPGTVIQGKLSFDTPVRIDGKLSGEIYSTRAIIVGAKGEVDAQVQVAALVVMGTVKGSVVASERIELLAGGRIEGDVTTPCIMVQSGAFFDGNCKMTAQPAASEKPRPAQRNEQRSDGKRSDYSPDAKKAPEPDRTGVVDGVPAVN